MGAHMEWIETLALALGASWVSGVRLYGCVATLGLLGRLGYIELPERMTVLQQPLVLGTAAVLFVVEFVADKIPAVDSVWDAVHGFLRVPAGAVLAWAAFGETDPALQAVALLIGGGLAFVSHGTKSAVRLVANASPEPFSNAALSVAEDGASGLALFAAVFLPVLGILLVAAGLALAVWIGRRAVRILGRITSGRSNAP
jgi:hypothetical protein